MASPLPDDTRDGLSSPMLRKLSLNTPESSSGFREGHYARMGQLSTSGFSLPPRSQRQLALPPTLSSASTPSSALSVPPHSEGRGAEEGGDTSSQWTSAGSIASPDACLSFDSVSLASVRSGGHPPLHPASAGLPRVRCHTEDAILFDTSFFPAACEDPDRSPSMFSYAHSPLPSTLGSPHPLAASPSLTTATPSAMKRVRAVSPPAPCRTRCKSASVLTTNTTTSTPAQEEGEREPVTPALAPQPLSPSHTDVETSVLLPHCSLKDAHKCISSDTV